MCQEGTVTSECVREGTQKQPWGNREDGHFHWTARESDLREDGWSPTRRNLRGAEFTAERPGSSGNRKSEIGPGSWTDL